MLSSYTVTGIRTWGSTNYYRRNNFWDHFWFAVIVMKPFYLKITYSFSVTLVAIEVITFYQKSFWVTLKNHKILHGFL